VAVAPGAAPATARCPGFAPSEHALGSPLTGGAGPARSPDFRSVRTGPSNGRAPAAPGCSGHALCGPPGGPKARRRSDLPETAAPGGAHDGPRSGRRSDHPDTERVGRA